jgi:hypothetical protein
MGTVGITEQCSATDVTHKGSETAGDSMDQAARAARLRYALASAGGSWGREFRLLLTLANNRGVSLDADALVFYDVRDLQALQRCIMGAGAPRRGLVASR